MKPTHILISIKEWEEVGNSDRDRTEFVWNCPQIDLSEKAIEEKATELYTTHSAIGNNTMVNGISIDGYKQAIKDLLNQTP